MNGTWVALGATGLLAALGSHRGSRDWGGKPKGFGAPGGRTPYIIDMRSAQTLVDELNARDWEEGYAYEVAQDNQGIYVQPIDLTMEQVLQLEAEPVTRRGKTKSQFTAQKGNKNVEDRWTAFARKHLLGKKIVGVRYLTREEADSLGWYQRSLLLELDDGSIIFMAKDDEGNDAGALFGQTLEEELTFPVIP